MTDLKILAKLLDSKFQGPLGIRFGLDAILGLIPGIGDFVTNSMGAYIVFRAGQMGYPKSIQVRMILNLIVDNLIELVPFFGNLFDFFYRANEKNVQLIQDYEINPQKTQRSSLLLTTGLFVFLVMILLGFTFLSFWIAVEVISALMEFLSA